MIFLFAPQKTVRQKAPLAPEALLARRIHPVANANTAE